MKIFAIANVFVVNKKRLCYTDLVKVNSNSDERLGENNMDVCYNKLFKLLIDKGMKKTEFAKEVGISANTLAKLSHNENVSMDIIVRICRKMNCTVDEILDILPEPIN